MTKNQKTIKEWSNLTTGEQVWRLREITEDITRHLLTTDKSIIELQEKHNGFVKEVQELIDELLTKIETLVVLLIEEKGIFEIEDYLRIKKEVKKKYEKPTKNN